MLVLLSVLGWAHSIGSIVLIILSLILQTKGCPRRILSWDVIESLSLWDVGEKAIGNL